MFFTCFVCRIFIYALILIPFWVVNRVEVRNVKTHILKMVAACTSETSAVSPTTTRRNNSRTKLTSTINHPENLKPVIKRKNGQVVPVLN
jgi:hypothetical protein